MNALKTKLLGCLVLLLLFQSWAAAQPGSLQVNIEVRFITVSDSFFERIGIDFDVQIDENAPVPTPPITDDPLRLFPNPGFDNSSVSNPFSPTFGSGFLNPEAATFGMAILSDIEAFFFIQAAQADQRTKVLASPQIIIQNGQVVNVADPFRWVIPPIVGAGVTLLFQPVISEDRRFVRLTLLPVFSGINSVHDFDFVGGTPPVDGGNPGTIQQPPIFPIKVATAVTVPDGGTVVLGGLQRLNGPNPLAELLGNLPFISRLFQNAAVRHTDSVMLMVTPRIIIQEEEE